VSGRVGPPGRVGGPGTALMPLVPCWPGPRHGKARRPIKPIGPDCASMTGGADPSSAAMRLPASAAAEEEKRPACGPAVGEEAVANARPGRGGGDGGRRGPAMAEPPPRRKGGGRLDTWQWRTKRQPARPSHGGGGGGWLGALRWRTRRRPARRQAVA
jgi:hypothetical protein